MGYRYRLNNVEADPQEYDNKHLGQRGFIIGGGPSIKNLSKSFDFERLRSEISIGVNRAYEVVTPTYLVFADQYIWERYNQEMIDVESIRLCPDNIAWIYDVPPEKFLIFKRSGNEDVQTSFSQGISFRNNTGVGALRIAYILGLNPIYLIGFDFTKLSEKANFHEGYGEGREASDKDYGDFFRSCKQVINKLKERQVKVFSCSSISRLNMVIPYVELQSLF